jgi:probable HAF family extracellular repeat protein
MGRATDPGADLGTLPGFTNSIGYAINASGQVAGESRLTGGASHAFRSSPNGQPVTLTDLGTLPGDTYSTGIAINALGVLVGTSNVVGGSGPGHPFVYDTQMRNLNTLIPAGDWMLYGANGINDAGQITGWGIVNGEVHAFRLTPVPEPSALALAGAALACAWAARGRARQTRAV